MCQKYHDAVEAGCIIVSLTSQGPIRSGITIVRRNDLFSLIGGYPRLFDFYRRYANLLWIFPQWFSIDPQSLFLLLDRVRSCGSSWNTWVAVRPWTWWRPVALRRCTLPWYYAKCSKGWIICTASVSFIATLKVRTLDNVWEIFMINTLTLGAKRFRTR